MSVDDFESHRANFTKVTYQHGSTKLKKNHSYITKVYTLDIQECTLFIFVDYQRVVLVLLWKTFTLLLLSAIDP